jgi:hypothetical protein
MLKKILQPKIGLQVKAQAETQASLRELERLMDGLGI